jgi:hypothetical protein
MATQFIFTDIFDVAQGSNPQANISGGAPQTPAVFASRGFFTGSDATHTYTAASPHGTFTYILPGGLSTAFDLEYLFTGVDRPVVSGTTTTIRMFIGANTVNLTTTVQLFYAYASAPSTLVSQGITNIPTGTQNQYVTLVTPVITETIAGIIFRLSAGNAIAGRSLEIQGFDNGANLCVAAGTRVDTPSGSVAVETLARGDAVNVWDYATRAFRVERVARVFLSAGTRARDPYVVLPKGYCVDAGSVPLERDLRVTRAHPVLRGNDLVEACLLLDGAGERLSTTPSDVSMYNLQFEREVAFSVEGGAALLHAQSPCHLSGPLAREDYFDASLFDPRETDLTVGDYGLVWRHGIHAPITTEHPGPGATLWVARADA